MATAKELAIYNRNAALDRLLLTQEAAKVAENDRAGSAIFKARYGMIRSHYDDFLAAHPTLIPLLKAEDYPDAETKSKAADEAYFSSKGVFETIYPVTVQQSVLADGSSPADSDTASNHSSNNFNNIKLPKLSLPSFDGSLNSWQTFRDMFNSLIHENTSISNVEKFQYLVGSLSKVPLQIVSSLPINHNNYTVAYQLLTDRYQNKRLLASEHWRAILHAPVVASESAELLQKTIDTFTKNVAALKSLGINTDGWDFILFSLLLDKLDIDTKKSFEKSHSKTELPTFEQLKSFVTEHSNALARVRGSSSKPHVFDKSKIVVNKPRIVNSFAATSSNFAICNESHYITNCPTFLKLNNRDRYQKARELRLCNNCLKNHFVKNCPSKFNCRVCNQRHHSLLHFDSNKQTLIATQSHNSRLDAVPSTSGTVIPSTVLTNTTSSSSHTLLATAVVKVRDNFGKLHSCRCLLDSAAQPNFITRTFVARLGLTTSRTNFAIQGINSSLSHTSGRVDIYLQSQYVPFQCSLSCLVVPNITSNLPSVSFNSNLLALPPNVSLADPQFYISNSIDMLIGADLFWSLLSPGIKYLGKNQPVLKETKLGWIVSGPLPTFQAFSLTCTQDNEISNSPKIEHSSLTNETLLRFWQIEEPELKGSVMSFEEKECEKHFLSTVTRTSSGRFLVTIPFNTELLNQLGESRELALRRFHYLENKLVRSPQLQEQYVAFMKQYLDEGHMSQLSFNETLSAGYYIPHHAVIKESISTKLRVVFDASMKTSSGISFNQAQLVGPVVQNDLLSIMLRFRQHTFVFTGDIQRMYRQVLVAPHQRCFQRIFWRNSSDEPVHEYELNTVTYGTASAPFLPLAVCNNSQQKTNPPRQLQRKSLQTTSTWMI